MPNVNVISVVHDQLTESLHSHEELCNSARVLEQIAGLATICANAISTGGLIFFAGNGGSLADAQHLSAELCGTMGRMRASLPGIALGVNSSTLSAIGNDFGYEFTLARELEALARPNSVVIALTTSGNSSNILKLIDSAKAMKLPVVVLSGQTGGMANSKCEVIKVPSTRTERIQEMHILIGHTLVYAIEEILGSCSPKEST